MPAIEFRTIADFVRGQMSITAYCKGRDCHRGRRLDLAALADRFGPELDLYAVDLRPRMRCAECGKKGATFIISPP